MNEPRLDLIHRVKALHVASEASLVQCRSALLDTKGDLAKAEDLLKKRGQHLPENRKNKGKW